MAWTETCYPVAMDHLPSAVRAKAIEIANELLAEGWPDDDAARVGIDRAKELSLRAVLNHFVPRNQYHR